MDMFASGINTNLNTNLKPHKRRHQDHFSRPASRHPWEAAMLSRIAENLYWIGRYVERAENTARLLDVNYHAVIEAAQTPLKP